MNKARLLPFFLVLFVSFSVFAQETLKHEKTTYTDGNGRFYVNQHLGVYLFLSSSPDGKDMKKLVSESTPEYANPFYLDTEGYNSIRTPSQVDPKTRKTVQPLQDLVFEVFADGLSPKSTLLLRTKNKYYAKGISFYGKALSIDIPSKDITSGVKTTYYSIDKQPYKAFENKFEYDTEGEHVISYYAVDNVGNAEEPRSFKFTVDISSPKTKYEVVGIKEGRVLSNSSKIKLLSSDAISGVENTYYRIGDKKYTYTGPIPLSYLTNGDHDILFYAIDNVKNNNADDASEDGDDISKLGDEFDFEIDNLAPEATLDIVGDQFKGKYHYVSPRTKIKLAATDKNGVMEIRYGVDKAAKDVYASEFLLLDKVGFQKVYYQAEDNIRNISTTKSKTIYYDKKAPITGINYKTPQFFNRDTLFVNNKTQIGFFNRDTESGVAKTEYSIDGAAFKEYTAKFTVGGEGFHKVEYRSTDKVNNVETTKSSQFVVDNNAPSIFINYSILKVGEREKDGVKYPVYPSYTRMYIGATDKYAGTETIYYGIDGGKLVNYATVAKNVSEANLFTKNKFYTVKVVAKDKLGNESTKEVGFFIDDSGK